MKKVFSIFNLFLLTNIFFGQTSVLQQKTLEENNVPKLKIGNEHIDRIFGLTNDSLPKKVRNYINSLGLQPLRQIDSTSTEIPLNFFTKSNWHFDYYARITANDGPAQIDVYELIYNDSIFCSSMRSFNTRKKIVYDFMEVKDETHEFIYFGIKNMSIDEYLYVVSKTKDNTSFQFSDILFKDMTNGIFVEYSYAQNCVESEFPLVLNVTNIKSDKYDLVKFSGYCPDIKYCLNKLSYSGGKLIITATLRKRKTKKIFREVIAHKI